MVCVLKKNLLYLCESNSIIKIFLHQIHNSFANINSKDLLPLYDSTKSRCYFWWMPKASVGESISSVILNITTKRIDSKTDADQSYRSFVLFPVHFHEEKCSASRTFQECCWWYILDACQKRHLLGIQISLRFSCAMAKGNDTISLLSVTIFQFYQIICKNFILIIWDDSIRQSL